LDSGELLRLLSEEEFAEVKSTSDGERLMIGSKAPCSSLVVPTTRLLSAGWRRRTLAKSTGMRSAVFFKVPCIGKVVCARRLPEDSAKATKSK